MQTIDAAPPTTRLGIGALVFALMGTAWLVVWAARTAAAVLAYGVIATLGVALAARTWRHYRRHAPAAETPYSEAGRRNRIFHWVNAAQWIAILVLGNVLANLGWGRWVVPMATIIIGVHFIPLAYLFRNRSLLVTAGAFIAFALAYPAFAAGGPADPVGFLGPGLLLWISAAWGLRAPTAAGTSSH
jgi:hypothetical protein